MSAAAEQEVESALDRLRAGAPGRCSWPATARAGFSRSTTAVGTRSTASSRWRGGNVGNQTFREKLGESVAQARQLVADGKGDERTRLLDFEGAKGSYPVLATPANYLRWFEPDGAMNQTHAIRNMNPAVPILFVAPRGDYPALARVKRAMFDVLPGHPLTELYEPDANHLGAPSASLDEILRWTKAVADQAGAAP